uniref:Fibronectin leucine rich transmembrane protein 1 n=1 Tax=Tetraodon nigroviridis TaxID=99883 RepID=H3BY90_TETNG
MATESIAELRDWLFLLLLCLTLLGEGDEGIVCPSVCRCDEGFVYCNDRGLSIIPPLPLMAAILYLQSNRLSNAGLPPSLERSTSIQVIYLYANQLDEFPIHLPPSLRELHLQDNNIRTLPRSALSKLPLLERLHLDDNSISTVSIQERAFSGTPRLRLLFLSRNHLSSIPAGLPASLEELRLDDNRISTIPTHAFRGLSSLRRLVLDGNLLANTRIADDTFSRLSNLTELSLVRNALQSPPVNLPSAHLIRLHLQDNGMTHIPRGALDGMKRLQKLDLSGNNLTSLPRGLLKDTENLELLLLRGNPWYCGCNLRWLHNWLHGRGSAVTVRGLTCQGPESVRGQTLRDLTTLMEQCEGPPAGPSPGAGINPADTTTTSVLIPTQGSLFTLRAKRPGLVMPLPQGEGGHVSKEALELTVKPLSSDSVLVSWLCPRPAPSFRLSWLRLGSSAALGSITETLVPGERRQYLLTQLAPRSHYLICLLPLRIGNKDLDIKDSTPACAQIETGDALVKSGEGGSDKEGQDSEFTALPLAGIIGGATALVSLLLIFGIFCWYGQRAGYISGDSGSYNRGRGGKHYDDYVESGTKKDTSILEIRAPPAGFQMTTMAHQPLQPKLEDVTYIHTIFPSSSSSSSQSHHRVTYGTNRGYREGGIPDIDYAYT